MQKNNYKDTPLWDSSLEIQERIDYLLAQMTLDEKFCFLATQTPAIERLGIEPFAIGGEAAHGVEARLPGLQDKISDIYLYLEGDVRITRFWMRGKSRNENG